MPNFTKDANTSRYFFGNLLNMFFPIEMTVYENSQVLNTFMLIYCFINLASISMDLADVLPGFNFSELKNSKMLKTLMETGRSELPWKHNFITTVGVSPVELLVCQVSLVSAEKWLNLIFVLEKKLGWLDGVISPLICIFYNFLSLNISRSKIDTTKGKTAFGIVKYSLKCLKLQGVKI